MRKIDTTELTVLGGGPAGLGVAFFAHRAGHRFKLYEKSSELGGMCRTFQHGGHRYDAGAHRFHDKDTGITRDLQVLLKGELGRVQAPSKIYWRGRYVDFPPTPLNAVLSHGIRGAGRIALELLRARWCNSPCVTFADFARNQFGETLARTFLINYSEKLWGLPAHQLDSGVATRRLHGMTLHSLLLELLLPSRTTAHIDGAFLYPRQGYGEITKRLAACLPQGSVALDHEVAWLESRGGAIKYIHFKDGSRAAAGNRVISTLPLTLLVKMLGDEMPTAAREAAARLRFRHIRMVFLRFNRPRISENASIYIPDPEFYVSRIYEPKNRSAEMAPEKETSLVVEVACSPLDKVDAMSDEALAERVIDELGQTGLISPHEVMEWRHHRLPFAYPVYNIGYASDVNTINGELASLTNLDTIGRASRYCYSHLHEQLRFGKDYVEAFGQSDEIGDVL